MRPSPPRAVRLLAALASGCACVALQAGAALAQASDSVRFVADDTELHGLIRWPAASTDTGAGTGVNRRPAVLLLPGGGTQYLTWEPDYFADRLTEAGFVTLVYHKRGTGPSGGDWATATLETLVADAGAAVELLRADARIDPERVAVMGFSQGGRFAPIVASRFDLAAAVGISGPALTAGDTRLYALHNALTRAGLDAARLDEAMELWREFIDLTRAGEDTAPLDDRIRDAASRMTAQALPPTSTGATPSPIFNSLDFDGSDDLRRLRAPFLAMYGELDPITPVAASVETMRRIFAETGYQGLNLIVIPGSAHGLNDETGERHVLYETVPVAWLVAHLAPHG